MLANHLKKLVRTHDPIFIGTDDPRIFEIQTVPFYFKNGIEVNLAPVILARVMLVDDIENSHANFSVWNSETLSTDIIYVQFL